MTETKVAGAPGSEANRPTRSTKPDELHSTASRADSTARAQRVYRYRPAGIRWPWRPEKRHRRRG